MNSTATEKSVCFWKPKYLVEHRRALSRKGLVFAEDVDDVASPSSLTKLPVPLPSAGDLISALDCASLLFPHTIGSATTTQKLYLLYFLPAAATYAAIRYAT